MFKVTTTLWCVAREHNKKRSRNKIVETSRQASCHTGTMHSTGARHRNQDPEQDCAMGQTSRRAHKRHLKCGQATRFIVERKANAVQAESHEETNNLKTRQCIRMCGTTCLMPRKASGNFKDVRFYPILNFGLFWAALSKMSVFYPTKCSSILGRPHFFSC